MQLTPPARMKVLLRKRMSPPDRGITGRLIQTKAYGYQKGKRGRAHSYIDPMFL